MQVETSIVQIKREHPGWGAPGIREKLRRRHDDVQTPAMGTVHAMGGMMIDASPYDRMGVSMSGSPVTASVMALCAALVASGAHDACAQGVVRVPSSPPSGAVVLIDSTGKVAARALTDTVVLVTVERDVTAPASIRPIYGPDGRMASGLASWQSGGSVLFTSPDCTVGAHVYSGTYAGARAATQVQTPDGIVLYVGAVGISTTVQVRSILYDTGCSPISVRQNGLFPVLATLNLSTTYPPPLSFQ